MELPTIALLERYPEHVQKLAMACRELILSHIPGISEMPDIPAKVIGFGFSNKYADTLCTLILSQKQVKIGFYKGAALPDPDHLLAGTGKVHQYVPIHHINEIHRTSLKALLDAAMQAWHERSMR